MSKAINYICKTILIVAVASASTATVSADTNDDISEALRRTEIKGGSTAKMSNKALEDLALLSKEVESTRTKYARDLELFIERIGSDKACDQSRINYEKAQIKLAGMWGNTRSLLPVLKDQEKLAEKWREHACTAQGLSKDCETPSPDATTGDGSHRTPHQTEAVQAHLKQGELVLPASKEDPAHVNDPQHPQFAPKDAAQN